MGSTWDDAKTVLPQGFIPSHLAPPELRGRAATELEYVALELGGIRLAADTIAEGKGSLRGDKAAAKEIGATATRLQRLVRAMAAGALGLAVLAGALVGGSAQPAAAAIEGPQPDPAGAAQASGAVYRVVLTSRTVTLDVPFVTTQTVQGGATGGLFCGSVWLGGSPLGYQCSTTPAFTVHAHLDGAALPVGASTIVLVDEATDNAVTATLEVRRPSKFGRGAWIDHGNGDIEVIAPIQMYSPAAGRWLPQNLAPVRVQERTRRGWRTRATLTSCNGVAAGIVHLGGGVHIVRVSRPLGATVTATTGRTRVVNVTTEPLDVN